MTDAESTLREALAMQKELLPENQGNMMISASYLAPVLEKQGKLAEVLPLYRQAAEHGILTTTCEGDSTLRKFVKRRF